MSLLYVFEKRNIIEYTYFYFVVCFGRREQIDISIHFSGEDLRDEWFEMCETKLVSQGNTVHKAQIL